LRFLLSVGTGLAHHFAIGVPNLKNGRNLRVLYLAVMNCVVTIANAWENFLYVGQMEG